MFHGEQLWKTFGSRAASVSPVCRVRSLKELDFPHQSKSTAKPNLFSKELVIALPSVETVWKTSGKSASESVFRSILLLMWQIGPLITKVFHVKHLWKTLFRTAYTPWRALLPASTPGRKSASTPFGTCE